MINSKVNYIVFLISEINNRFRENNISAYGAQIAYLLILSLFPFLIFLISVLAIFSLSIDSILNVLAKVGPHEVVAMVSDYIRLYLPEKSMNVLSVSFFATIWSASRGVNILLKALNRAYDVKENRSFFKRRILAMLFTIFLAFSIVLALVIPSMGMDFLLWVSKYLPITTFMIRIWYYIRWLVVIFILLLLIGLLYYIAPNKKIKLKDTMAGTIFAVFGWIIISLGFSYFVNNFRNYTIVYGSLAAIIVLMIWFYISGVILIAGGELNSINLKYKEVKGVVSKHY